LVISDSDARVVGLVMGGGAAADTGAMAAAAAPPPLYEVPPRGTYLDFVWAPPPIHPEFDVLLLLPEP